MRTPIPSGRVRSDVVAYPLDGELVLHDERQLRLFALNPTASFIWASLASGVGSATVAEELSRATGVPLERGIADVESMLRTWGAACLLADSVLPGGRLRPNDATPNVRRSPPQLRDTFKQAVRLMDRGLRIVADRDLESAIEAVFGSSFVADREARSDWPTVTIWRDADRWLLLVDDEVLASCRERAEIVPMIYGNSARLIYRAADCFAAVHAAAVASGGQCAMLPAASASGKSTLTAALIATGYRYCTDDLAILTAAPTRLRPVPMKIGLKSGSWDLLAQAWPELASQPSHRRADGQWIKYLDPRSRGPAVTHESLPVVAVVFPKFERGAAAELRRVSRAAALTRMAEAGYDLSGKLDGTAVQTLVDWFKTLECYELRFDDLDQAVALFARVL